MGIFIRLLAVLLLAYSALIYCATPQADPHSAHTSIAVSSTSNQEILVAGFSNHFFMQNGFMSFFDSHLPNFRLFGQFLEQPTNWIHVLCAPW